MGDLPVECDGRKALGRGLQQRAGASDPGCITRTYPMLHTYQEAKTTSFSLLFH